MQKNYSQELNLLEQVHLALGSASKLEDFYIITASLLVDPNTFGFSRAFLFRFDERSCSFAGKVALGARSENENSQFRRELLEEAEILKRQVDAAQLASPEPLAVQSLYNLRFHSLWIQLLQGHEEGTGLNPEFQTLTIRRDTLPPGNLLLRAAADPHARIYSDGDCSLEYLDSFITMPVVAGRLVTKRGLHGILIADRKYLETELDEQALYYFQWLLNHASVTLDNVELVEELTNTTVRLQEVDRLKTNFLSIVSHELRTPLTSIIGFVHLLSESKLGPLTGSQLDLLGRVANHSRHLQSMVNDLLEIAEVEAGGMVSVKREPVDPLVPLIAVIPKVEARRGTKNVSIEPVISENIPAILSDEDALERVYFHLLDNAVKFIQREGRVTIRFERQNRNLKIIITDTGIGIQPDNLKKIFDYFYQVDFRLERAYGGMGIGLTVVKMLLEAMNGQISVESKPNTGTTVTLTFPLAKVNGAKGEQLPK